MNSTVSKTIPVLATAGAQARKFFATRWEKLVRARHGFAVKLVLLLTIFVAVPAVLYGYFQDADQEKQRLILKAAQEQGRLIAESVKPMLATFDPRTSSGIGDVLARIGGAETKIKVLFRPADAAETGQFYYIASQPVVPPDYLEAERRELLETGIFKRVPASCERIAPTAARFTNPAGREELLVSLRSVNTDAGCWVIITSTAAEAFLGTGIARPYWQTPEMRVAIVIYLLMAVFVVLLFLDVWRGLRGFAAHARRVRTVNSHADTFAAQNRVPELDGVAREFDGMVASLRHSAQLIRFMAEDNAHAFKTPIAVIAQALEPIKRTVAGTTDRAQRSLEMIEHSVHRLEGLVSAARRMDEAAAEIIDPARERVNVSELLRRLGYDYAESLTDHEIRVVVDAPDSIVLFAQQDLLETVFENLVENAASFSPAGGTIRLTARTIDGKVELKVEDEGPGVDPADADRLFDRYYSNRTFNGVNGIFDNAEHFGVGLWIVRRNVEAIGGSVTAENRDDGGLCITMQLPLN